MLTDGVPMRGKAIAVDFDHTLVDVDKALPGARDAMETLKAMGYYIIIHSCNDEEWIRKTLNTLEIPWDEIWTSLGKPIADAYIDDRGIGFYGDWNESIADLMALEKRRTNIPRYCLRNGVIGFHVNASTETGAE